MTNATWEKAREAACETALQTWSKISSLYDTGSHVEEKPDGPSTQADKLADKIITQSLKEQFPPDRYGYLSEETEDNRDRLEMDRVWVIDPIDGTMDFIKKNGNFAIHIALVEKAADGLWQCVAASVYRPVPGEMYSAVKGGGSSLHLTRNNTLSGEPRGLNVSGRSSVGDMKAVMSASHRSPKLARIMDRFGFADTLSIGSLGIKFCLIARGDYDFYINPERGKCREWDTCAPKLILTEAGGAFTDLDGEAISFNKEDVTHRAGLLASNGKIHDELVRRALEYEQDGE